MHTITNPQTRGLPVPPISANNIPRSELPTIPLDCGTSEITTSITRRAKEIARKRNSSKADAGTLHGPRDAIEAHEIGHLGEIIAATTGLPLDQAEHISPDGDPGWDHSVLNQEETIDTKATATNAQKPSLVVSARDTPPADYFLLTHIVSEEDIGRIIGFIDRTSLTAQEPQRWPGENLNYVADWSDLYPPRFIKPLIIGRAVTETRDGDYIDEKGCQLCGAHLDAETETRRYIDDLDTEVGVCPDTCQSLLDAGRDQDRIAEFNLYERP